MRCTVGVAGVGVCDRTLRRCRCAGAIEFLRMMVDHYAITH